MMCVDEQVLDALTVKYCSLSYQQVVAEEQHQFKKARILEKEKKKVRAELDEMFRRAFATH
jgi:hypothetical protein